MEFVKRQLVLIVCGLVAALAITLGAFGLGGMSRVTAEMQQSVALAQRFIGYRRSSINTQAIEVERTRVNTIRGYYDDVLNRAKAINQYTPLLEGVFPNPNFDKKLEFALAYRKEMDRLLQVLKARTPATASDIEQARKVIEDEAKKKQPAAPGPAPGPTPPLAPKPPPPGASDKDRDTGLPTDELARTTPTIRAAIATALITMCYASPQTSLDINRNIKPGEPPKIAEMWNAQVSLWIQQDVIAALARVNDAAAGRIPPTGGAAWVGVMPVKDLLSIRVSPYVRKETAAEGGSQKELASPTGEEPARPPGSAEPYAAANVSNDLFDVVQFTLKLAVDQRDLPAIVNEICKNKFHRPLRIDYESVSPNVEMTGKIYGSEPTVRVVIDFESCLFTDNYNALMPDEVLKELGRERPKPKPGA